MFTTTEAVNYILDYSKMIIDDINKDKVCPAELKEIQYLIFAGMLSYYGFEEIETIQKAFRTSNFFYTNQSFENYAETHNIRSPRVSEMMKRGEVGAFVQYKADKFMGRYYIGRDVYILNKPGEAPDIFLEKAIHEVNHVVNSINNPICLRKGRKALRIGLYISDLELGDKEMMGVTAEEDFNVLQSAEIMEHILEFSQYHINDPGIRRALQKIKYAYGKSREGIGYAISAPVFKQLYENPHFKYTVKRNRMAGLIKPIRLDFEERLGEGSYNEFCDALDRLDVSSPLFWERYPREAKVKEFIKKYNQHR